MVDLNASRIMVAGHDARLDAEELQDMGESAARGATEFLREIDRHARTAKAAIDARQDESGDAAFYHQHHREQCGSEVAGETVEEMLGRLVPVAVWFAPDDEERDWNASIDYSLGEDVTDYLLSVRMDPRGGIVDVAMES